MILSRRACLSVVWAVGLLAAASPHAHGQTPPPVAGAEALTGSLPEHFAEVSRAQRVLMTLVPRAFILDPGLGELRTTFEEARDQAMVARDPETTNRRARLAMLEATYNQAMKSTETPDVATLVREGLELRRALTDTATAVRGEPAVAAAATAYEAALRAAFTSLRSIDPEMVPRLAESDRLLELVEAIGSFRR